MHFVREAAKNVFFSGPTIKRGRGNGRPTKKKEKFKLQFNKRLNQNTRIKLNRDKKRE